MYYTREEIRECVIDVMKEVTLCEIKDGSLIDKNLGIHPADFLYIFEILEDKLKVPIVEILMNSDYTVMQLDKFCNALWELQKVKI